MADKNALLLIEINRKGRSESYIIMKKTNLLLNSNTDHECKRAVLSASMTLEAAFIIPMFTFFVLTLVYVINLLNFQSRVNTVLYDVLRNATKFEYNLDDSVAKATALAQYYIKLSGINADNMNLVGGVAGVVPYFEDKEDDIIELSANYIAKTPFDFIGIRPLICRQNISLRKWIGNEDKEGESSRDVSKDTNKKMVYITDTGSVYHTNRNCTYLVLSISTVDSSSINHMRNDSGGKYYPCERCIRNKATSNTYYVTDWGDRYHINGNCSGLKRGVMTVPIDSIPGWSQCSRCLKNESH